MQVLNCGASIILQGSSNAVTLIKGRQFKTCEVLYL